MNKKNIRGNSLDRTNFKGGYFMKKQCCIICGRPLNDGIIINGIRMCNTCERNILNIKMNTDFYIHYKNRIKKSIIYTIIRGVNTGCQNYHL